MQGQQQGPDRGRETAVRLQHEAPQPSLAGGIKARGIHIERLELPTRQRGRGGRALGATHTLGPAHRSVSRTAEEQAQTQPFSNYYRYFKLIG